MVWVLDAQWQWCVTKYVKAVSVRCQKEAVTRRMRQWCGWWHSFNGVSPSMARLSVLGVRRKQ